MYLRLTEPISHYSVVEGNFNCTFDSDDYCGYMDQSEGTSKWVRSKEFKEGSPGNDTIIVCYGAA